MRSTWSATGALVVFAATAAACVGDVGTDNTLAVEETVVADSSACKVSYDYAGDWGSGFTASVSVTNKGAAIAAWELQFDFPAGQSIQSIWNATSSQSGTRATVKGPSWSAGLGAGASVSFGFNGVKAGGNATPVEFFLNGRSCGRVGAPTPPPTTPPPTTPPPTTPPPTTPPPSGCTAATWHAGTFYAAGTVVRYTDGKYYVAEHDNPGYDPVISTWYWDPTSCGGGTTPPPTTPPPTGGSGLAAILSEAQYNQMFPGRNSFYRYADLVAATASYPAFATTGDATARRREVAAFLANTGHETGDFVYIEEIAQAPYCAPSPGCPCASGKWYYGRGPIQLSWNYNYCAAGAALGLPLGTQPELVATNATISWQTGLWFWMTQTGAGSQTAHSAAVNGNFGETIRTINGSIECNGGNPGAVSSRVQRYRRFCQLLGVDPGGNTGC